MANKHILILHGPNLNLLGEREPDIYGTQTLPQINSKLRSFCKRHHLTVKIHQSNSEGTLIDIIHKNRKWADALVINPAAYTHYSYAIRDAIRACYIPTVEVHLSNLNKRESFRKKSVISPVCLKQISGLGWNSYIKGIEYVTKRLTK